MPDDVSEKKIVLVGPGRAGRAFARSWTRAGGPIEIAARDLASARSFVGDLPRGDAIALDDRVRLSGAVLVLAVPDDSIRALAGELAGRADFRFAFHLSGALPAAAMAPLAAKGAAVGSLHPLRAFTGSPDEDWAGSFVAVEGDEAAAEAGVGISRSVGARPHRVSAHGKPLYHAAATLAAGGSASLLSLATRVWVEAGLEEEEGRRALAELAAGAIAAVGKLPFAQALTGPVARRDMETIRLHAAGLAGLPGGPEAAHLYALLAAETLRRTAGRGREPEIEALLAPCERIEGLAPAEPGEKPEDAAPGG